MEKNYLLKSLTRLKALPIDDKSVFENKAKILFYISHPRTSAYEGQLIFSKEEKTLFLVCQKTTREFYLDEVISFSKTEIFEKLENQVTSEMEIKDENISDKKYPTTKAVYDLYKNKIEKVIGNENAIPVIDSNGNLKDSGFNIEKLIIEILSRLEKKEEIEIEEENIKTEENNIDVSVGFIDERNFQSEETTLKLL